MKEQKQNKNASNGVKEENEEEELWIVCYKGKAPILLDEWKISTTCRRRGNATVQYSICNSTSGTVMARESSKSHLARIRMDISDI